MPRHGRRNQRHPSIWRVSHLVQGHACLQAIASGPEKDAITLTFVSPGGQLPPAQKSETEGWVSTSWLCSRSEHIQSPRRPKYKKQSPLQDGPGTEPEPETRTVGPAVPGIETEQERKKCFQAAKPELEPVFSVKSRTDMQKKGPLPQEPSQPTTATAQTVPCPASNRTEPVPHCLFEPMTRTTNACICQNSEPIDLQRLSFACGPHKMQPAVPSRRCRPVAPCLLAQSIFNTLLLLPTSLSALSVGPSVAVLTQRQP